MLNVIYSGQFKKDYKKCLKRGLDTNLLKAIIATLSIPEPLPPKNRDHYLTGNYKGRKECHIEPDWLLIYEVDGNDLYLIGRSPPAPEGHVLRDALWVYLDRTGTHSDLFKS